MDARQARSQATQAALMRAAEKLIAERGIGNVTIRDIVTEAGQKNESALHYHFRNLAGLIDALHESRTAEIQSRRATLLSALLERTPQPSLRQLCKVMVQPTFELARANADFRDYVKAFGHEMAVSRHSAFSLVGRHGGGGASGRQTGALLRLAMAHLNEAGYRRRMESAVRFCAVSMYSQARQKNGFRGRQAELFFHSLVDALVGLLSAPESEQTRRMARNLRNA